MAYLGLPAALAKRGLTVETVAGWETRSAGSLVAKGALCHWTAGPANSTTRPSLNIVVNGRSDLPGPLCNVYLDRNGVAVVVSGNRANHAGVGNWKGLTANSQLFGTEAESAGPTDFTPAQRIAYPKVNAAYCDLGGFGADMVAGHSEYALPAGRKVDINAYPMTEMRAKVAAILTGTLEEDVPLTAQEIAAISDAVANRGLGAYGAAWQTWNAAVAEAKNATTAANKAASSADAAAKAIAGFKPAAVNVDAAAVASALASDSNFLAALAAAVNDAAAKRLAS